MTEEVGTPDPIYQRGMTRGALVAGGATLAGAVAATTASAAPVGTAVVAGFIESIDRSGSVTIRTIERVVDVRLESTAEFWRDHPVDIAAFDIGDEVAAEGSWTQEGFVASALFAVFRPISGTVTARRGDQLLIGSTQVVLTPFTRTRDGWDEVALPGSWPANGDTVDVLGRVDPRSGRMVAALVFPSGG
jgi:hypothetical protein